MSSPVYLYARLHVSLNTLAVHALFEEQDGGLESLSEILTPIVVDPVLSKVYTDAAVIDIVEMSLYSQSDESLGTILSDFHVLTRMIQHIHQEHAFDGLGQLYAIHLELPNTLIFEYRRPGL